MMLHSGKRWKKLKNLTKLYLQNKKIDDIMIDGLFSKGVKYSEGQVFRKTDLRKMQDH